MKPLGRKTRAAKATATHRELFESVPAVEEDLQAWIHGLKGNYGQLPESEPLLALARELLTLVRERPSDLMALRDFRIKAERLSETRGLCLDEPIRLYLDSLQRIAQQKLS